jgi:hypothetical protein
LIKAAKDEKRAAKAERKAERRTRRELQLAQRASANNSPAPNGAVIESESDLSDFSDLSAESSAATSPSSLSPLASPSHTPVSSLNIVSDTPETDSPITEKLEALSSTEEDQPPQSILDLPVMNGDASPSQRLQAEVAASELTSILDEGMQDAFAAVGADIIAD